MMLSFFRKENNFLYMYLIGHTGIYSQFYPQGKLEKEYLAFPAYIVEGLEGGRQ